MTKLVTPYQQQVVETNMASSEDDCLINDEDSKEDEDDEPSPSPREGERPLLFCYQTEKQTHLLKYDEICLMDTTYKTTRCALPLFFLCVRTNVSYQVVGAFVVQYSTTEAISEALEIFKMWNLTWRPRYFIVDFAEEEIYSLKDVF